MVDNPVVLIVGDRITAVGPGLAIPNGYEVIDLGDVDSSAGTDRRAHPLTTTYKYLLFGGPMQDAVTAFARARSTLDAGSPRCASSGRRLHRRRVARRDQPRRRLGPRMQVATLALGSTGGHDEDVLGLARHPDTGAIGIADGVDAVRRLSARRSSTAPT